MTPLPAPTLFDPVNVTAEGWPYVTIAAGFLALIFLVPAIHSFDAKAVIKSVLIMLFCAGLVIFGFYAKDLPENSFEGKTLSATLKATAAIKAEVQSKYALEILEENIFETSKTKEGFSTITDTKVKPLTKVLHSSGTVIDVVITVNEERTEVTVTDP